MKQRPTLAVNKDSVLVLPSHRHEHHSIFRIWTVLLIVINAKPFISMVLVADFLLCFPLLLCCMDFWYRYKDNKNNSCQKIKHFN